MPLQTMHSPLPWQLATPLLCLNLLLNPLKPTPLIGSSYAPAGISPLPWQLATPLLCLNLLLNPLKPTPLIGSGYAPADNAQPPFQGSWLHPCFV